MLRYSTTNFYISDSYQERLFPHRHKIFYSLINSAATSREEIGNPPHYGTVGKLREKGIALVPHRAVQMTAKDHAEYDYLIGMDTANIRNMTRIAGGDREGRIHKLLTFAGSGRDVADPWYTGDFDATYRDVMEGCRALLAHILENEADRL